MEIKYIKTLNYLKRCNEIKGVEASQPPIGISLYQHYINCQWLNDNNYIKAVFNNESYVVVLVILSEKGKAVLDDYHDELLEKIRNIAKRKELSLIHEQVLNRINAKVFSQDWDYMDEIEVLEAIVNITNGNNPKIEAEQFVQDMLNSIDRTTICDLAVDTFIWIMKIYTILRYRFHEDIYYRDLVFPVLHNAMKTIKNNIFGNKNKKFLNELDNIRKNNDYDYSNYMNNNSNMHSDEEYQKLLNKIQVLEADNKRLMEENGELVRKLKEQEEPLVEESVESDEEHILILGELKENIYPAEIRAHIASVLLRKALGKDISQTWAAGILVRNITIFGTPGYLQKKINSDMTFDASYYKEICGEVNCLLERIGIDYRIKCKYKGNETFDMPTADWNDMKRKYPKIEKKLPETP